MTETIIGKNLFVMYSFVMRDNPHHLPNQYLLNTGRLSKLWLVINVFFCEMCSDWRSTGCFYLDSTIFIVANAGCMLMLVEERQGLWEGSKICFWIFAENPVQVLHISNWQSWGRSHFLSSTTTHQLLAIKND